MVFQHTPIMLLSVRWKRSTVAFVEALYTVICNLSIPNKRQTSVISSPSSSLALSVNRDRGQPNLQITCSTTIHATVATSLFAVGNASAHLENASTIVTIYREPHLDFGWGPVMSGCMRSNGTPASIGCKGPDHGNWPRKYPSQFWHCLQCLRTSPRQPGQNARLRTWWSVRRMPKWPPFMPRQVYSAWRNCYRQKEVQQGLAPLEL